MTEILSLPRMPKKKPVVALVSLSCCEGCLFAIYDLHERFFNLLKDYAEIGESQITRETFKKGPYDIAIVEGTPITKANVQMLKEIRKRSKILVALGDCATHGCIQTIKNFIDKEKAIKHVYKDRRGIDNPDIRPIKDFVKVDYEILGCPINAEEFVKFFLELKDGKMPKPPTPRSVCYDCQLKGIECLLQKGEACLGPAIIGGCGATCPEANYRCEGCRGVIKENPGLLNFVKQLKKVATPKEINHILEKFGIRKEWEEEIKKAKANESKN